MGLSKIELTDQVYITYSGSVLSFDAAELPQTSDPGVMQTVLQGALSTKYPAFTFDVEVFQMDPLYLRVQIDGRDLYFVVDSLIEPIPYRVRTAPFDEGEV